jgi:hypothetical protein
MELVAEAAGVDPARLDELELDMDGDFDPEQFEAQLSVSWWLLRLSRLSRLSWLSWLS